MLLMGGMLFGRTISFELRCREQAINQHAWRWAIYHGNIKHRTHLQTSTLHNNAKRVAEERAGLMLLKYAAYA